MIPSGLAWILLYLQISSSSSLVLSHRGEDGQPSAETRRSFHLLHPLFGHKRALQVAWSPPGRSEDLNWKRAPNGLGASGFHGDVFSQGFGAFSPVKRGLHWNKRRPEMTASGFYGDVFTGGMGNFDTMKRRPEMTASGFYDDVFSGGMGHFDTMKRRPEMTASGFYGDVFNGGMGHFDTMKRRPEMTANGFYGDIFKGGMGHFDTMKRRPEMTASGFYGDIFKGGMGHFDTMKRRPEMTASGFYDDVFSGGMGHFDTMKRTFAGGGASKGSDGADISPRMRSTSNQATKSVTDDSQAKDRANDEILTAKGLQSDLLQGSMSEFNTMR